jgi:O-antigen/teichoic acid export membrane protein
MNTVQRIAKNTGVLLISQIASYILGFFFIIQTLRKFDQNALQQSFEKSLIKMRCSFALAFTGIFGVFADLGLRQLTVREVARDKSLAGKYLLVQSNIYILLK